MSSDKPEDINVGSFAWANDPNYPIKDKGESLEKFKLVAQKLKEAEYVIITAGYGMGVDSGVPDNRGPPDFWKTFP